MKATPASRNISPTETEVTSDEELEAPETAAEEVDALEKPIAEDEEDVEALGELFIDMVLSSFRAFLIQ